MSAPPAPPCAPRPAVYATAVRVEVGGREVVRSCDLTVGRGAFVAVVGPNGAGKTTLLRALAGLVPAEGRIELLGAAVGELRPRRRAQLVALVPQSPLLPLSMAVAHYVLLGRTAHLGPLGRESRHDLAVVEEALDELDLLPLAHRRLATLSGGERQRALVARGLAQGAPILLLDEPTTALDLAHQQHALELVDRVRRDRQLSVVATMHDLTLAAQYAEHLVVLHHGEVALSGPAAQVLTGPQLRRVYGADVDVLHHRGRVVVVPTRSPIPDPQSPTHLEVAP